MENKKQRELEEALNDLIFMLRKESWEKYKRVNPFTEDLVDWKKKGEYLFGKGKNITIYDTCTVVGEVDVGENTWIGPYTSLDGNGGLKIGKYCSISSHVNIVSHDTVLWALSGGKHTHEYAPIKIGDCCFIGTGATITKGVSIGNHCLIGAGAVVIKNIPDNSIAVGIPAKLVGKVNMQGDHVKLEYN